MSTKTLRLTSEPTDGTISIGKHLHLESGANLIFDAAATIQGSINIGVSGNTINMRVSGVTYNMPSITRLSDVSVTSPSNTQVLTYMDGTWKNQTPDKTDPNAIHTTGGTMTGDLVMSNGSGITIGNYALNYNTLQNSLDIVYIGS